MAEEIDYRVCPACRTEYTRMATRCADCDVELVHADVVAEEDAQVEDLPPASALRCVRVAPIAWIRALSEGLQHGGVPHRVEPAGADDAPEGQRVEAFGNVQLFGLYVREADTDAAREIDGSIAARILPEEAPALAEGEEDACPACATPLAPDATECPDCGLGFG